MVWRPVVGNVPECFCGNGYRKEIKVESILNDKYELIEAKDLHANDIIINNNSRFFINKITTLKGMGSGTVDSKPILSINGVYLDGNDPNKHDQYIHLVLDSPVIRYIMKYGHTKCS